MLQKQVLWKVNILRNKIWNATNKKDTRKNATKKNMGVLFQNGSHYKIILFPKDCQHHQIPGKIFRGKNIT